MYYRPLKELNKSSDNPYFFYRSLASLLDHNVKPHDKITTDDSNHPNINREPEYALVFYLNIDY